MKRKSPYAWILGLVALMATAGIMIVVLSPVLFPRQCIAEGTAGDTPEGPVRIETIRPGQVVWTRGPSEKKERGRVVAVHPATSRSTLEISLEDGSALRATASHPVAGESGWVESGSLRIGDRVQTREGSCAIRSITTRHGEVRVYDLEVEPNPNFIAAGILVHNKSVPWRNASACLKTISTAQAEFRANDRDGNGVQDFWVADVAGLYWIEGAAGVPHKLIEEWVARADATPRPGAGGTSYKAGPSFETKQCYAYRSLTYYEQPDGKRAPYDEGNGRNSSRFGFIAYPHPHRKGVTTTLILNEANTMYRKETDGSVIDTFPHDPVKAGWIKMD